MILKNGFFIILLAFIFSGCNQSTPEGFQGLNISEEDLSFGEVSIQSVTPDAEMIYLTEDSITFAVSLAPGAGLGVKYKFFIDGFEVQNGDSPFYVMNTTAMTARDHTLKVVASNPVSSDEYTFNLYKNTPPSLSHISNSTMNISCSGGSFNMQVVASDADGDSVDFSFLVNGIENAPGSSGSVTSILASHTYTPPGCSVQGVQQVTIRGTDTRGGVTDYTIAVNVLNPNVAAITTFSPTDDPVTIKSTESINFLVGATGAPPLTYVWSIDPGSAITRCADKANCSISGGDFSPGAYVLNVLLSDSIPTQDDHDFNIVINAKPSITFKVPSSNNTTRMNCSLSKNFQITFEDDNYNDPGQSISVTWTVDGFASPTLGISTNTINYPFTSTATFSPNCNSSLLGQHTITATISDGHEEITSTWIVQTNYLPEACNSILNDPTANSRGRICTLAGLPGMGSGVNTVSDPQKVKINPSYLAEFDPAVPEAFFVSDNDRHVIWFYNGTNAPLTVIGKTVASKELAIILGAGAGGTGTLGQSYTNFFLNSPNGLYYDRGSDRLYVAEYNLHRILVVGSDGRPSVFAGGRTASGDGTDGLTNTNHRCHNPTKIIRAGDDLLVACYGSRANGWGVIKRFSLTTQTGSTLLKYNGAHQVTEGTLGSAGTGGAWGPFAMVKHPSEDVLFAADFAHWCRMYAINYGATSVSFDGISVTVPAGSIRRISNNNGCGNSYGRAYNDGNLRIYPYALGVKTDPSTGELQGLFTVELHYHFIGFFNLSSSPVVISGITTNPGFFQRIIGSGAAAYSRGSPTHISTSLSGPRDILATSLGQIFTDRVNGIVAKFDGHNSSISNTVSDIFGYNFQFGFDGIEDKTTTDHHLYTPTAILYEPRQNRLLFHDSNNFRVRSINLITGKILTEIGNGSNGDVVADPVLAQHSSFRLRNVRDMASIPGEDAIVFIDAHSQYNVPGPVTPPNTNNLVSCIARVWNFGDSYLNQSGFTIEENFVKTVVGDRAYGCANWNNDHYNGRQATDVALNNPQGVIYSPTGDIFISNYYNHCILKVDGVTNAISQYVGLCGTAQDNIMGPVGDSRFNYPGDLQLDSDATLGGAGNFFVVDRAYNSLSSIKYVNLSPQDVNLFGVGDIPSHSVGRLVITEGFTTAVAAFENQVCYNQGNGRDASTTPHNIICADRDTGLTTLRIGRSSASVVKAGVQVGLEDEGIHASSALLYNPHGLAFDSEGNLYITESWAHTIRMVKRWW